MSDKNWKWIIDKRNWIIYGLVWGALMLLADLLFPLISGDKISLKQVLIGIPIWLLGGLSFGYMMKLYFKWYYIRKEKLKTKEAQEKRE